MKLRVELSSTNPVDATWSDVRRMHPCTWNSLIEFHSLQHKKKMCQNINSINFLSLHWINYDVNVLKVKELSVEGCQNFRPKLKTKLIYCWMVSHEIVRRVTGPDAHKENFKNKIVKVEFVRIKRDCVHRLEYPEHN